MPRAQNRLNFPNDPFYRLAAFAGLTASRYKNTVPKTAFNTLAVLLFFYCGAAMGAFAPTTRPVEAIDRVVIISIDGGRPDLLLRANTPNLRALLKRAAFTWWARTVPIAITLPSHTSMLTGVSVERHGIDFNDERGTTRPIYPHAVTLFEIAKNYGYTTALISGKSKFETLAKPGTVDWLSAPETTHSDDNDVAANACRILREHHPQVTFIHFPGGDVAGHAKGWGTPEQIAAFEAIDQDIGQIVHVLDEQGLTAHTLMIVTADHGGSGRVHGETIPDSINIPWIAAGPGVRQNYDLTLISNLTINTFDTFATACWIMGIPVDPAIDGKPITQILPGQELLTIQKP